MAWVGRRAEKLSLKPRKMVPWQLLGGKRWYGCQTAATEPTHWRRDTEVRAKKQEWFNCYDAMLSLTREQKQLALRSIQSSHKWHESWQSKDKEDRYNHSVKISTKAPPICSLTRNVCPINAQASFWIHIIILRWKGESLPHKIRKRKTWHFKRK